MKPKNYENINPVAQMLIDYFNGKVDDYILEQLTDCFVGFTSNMQGKMVKYFIDDFFASTSHCLRTTGIQVFSILTICWLRWSKWLKIIWWNRNLDIN